MDVLAREADEEQLQGEPAGWMAPAQSAPEPAGKVTRRSFLRTALGTAGAAAVGVGLYSGEIARHELVTERRGIGIENLPEAFAGMRIAQISDFHYASYTEPYYLRRMVTRVNALKPDMVLLTGDFVSMAPVEKSRAEAYAPLCAAILGELVCPLRYGVLGNHDWMVNGDLVRASLRDVGIPILVNESVPLERNGGRIWLAGLADAMSRDVDIPATIPKHARAAKEPVILMGHEPDLLDAVAQYGVDLMLSGHTHGGQVRLPGMRPRFLPPLGQRYVAGHFLRGRTQLYVNRGIGTVGLPLRLNCPSEITEITLHAA